jgi:hypothetical protein
VTAYAREAKGRDVVSRVLARKGRFKSGLLFPKKRTKTIADIGLLQNATDAEIVKAAAWERQLTIVTGNGNDFIKEITNFLAQTKKASDGCP